MAEPLAARPTIAELVRTSGLPIAEARALLAHVLAVPRERLIARPQTEVDAAQRARFDTLAARRRAGEPLAYLLGAREFYGRMLHVTPAVLIPRPETELLIDLTLNALRDVARPRVLDLGTGSGCIAVTLALERPDARVVAVDRSEDALAVARANAQALGARVEFRRGEWYAALTGVASSFDAIVANPPYVARDDPHLAQGDVRFEPRAALTDEADGLTCLRAVIAGAGAFLSPGGWLAVEHGYDQASAVRRLMLEHGMQAVASHADMAGIERVTAGRKAL
jgi:release factor glutamine methyltransferase